MDPRISDELTEMKDELASLQASLSGDSYDLASIQTRLDNLISKIEKQNTNNHA